MNVNPDVALLVTIFVVVAYTGFRAGYGGVMPSVTSLAILAVMIFAVWAGAY